MTLTVNYFFDDAEKRVLVGLPEAKKVSNPFYDAGELERQGKRKEAERIYLELLNTDFNNSAIKAALGMNYAIAEKNGLAYVLLKEALADIDNMIDDLKRLGITVKAGKQDAIDGFINLKKSEVLNAIGTCFKHENKTTEAREHFEHAQSLIPPDPNIQNNLGTLYINEGKPAKALEHLNQALTIDPCHAQAHWNRSLCYLEMGDYERGWPEYGWGLRAKVRMDRNYMKDPLPFWDGTPGKKVVVYGEQGIGDEILFASCLPDLLKDCPNIVFECHKKLHTLFASSFPQIPAYPTREDDILTWPVLPDGKPRYDFDARIPIGNLPMFYRKSIEDFPGTPYLQPSAKAELHWNERLAALPKKPNVGISWAGGHKRTRLEVRSIDLERLLPILKTDVNWISLQYTPCEDEIKAVKDKHGIDIHHWPEAVYSPNYDDTAGLVANLDLVITVCTSVVHLAGSMGVPTWVMTPSRPAWRYRLDLDVMPWYQQTILFRQEPDSTDWTPVIEEVAENLKHLMEDKEC